MTATITRSEAAVAETDPGSEVRRRALPWVAAATGMAWSAIMAARLFVGGAIGMGDQGDGRRLLCQLGVRATTPFNASASTFIHPTLIAHRWYGEACSADGSGGVFRSSELWLLSMAEHLTPLLGLPGSLDLRALGVLCAVLVGLVVAALVVLLPGPVVVRVVVASLVALLAADSMIAQFFISPYSEPAELIGTLALCPALLGLWRRGHTTWPALAAVAFLGTVTIGAKTQAAALLPALVVGLLWGPHGPTRRPATTGGHAIRAGRWLIGRWPGLMVAALLVGATGYFVVTAPVGLTQQQIYGEVFGEILPHSHDPAADLRALGADPSLASAVGSNPESTNAATLRPEYLRFRTEVTQGRIIEFYLTHPDRLVAVGSDGLKGVDQWRQNYLGSYLANSRQPAGTIEGRVGAYGALFQHAWQPVLVLVWLATLYVGIRTARRRTLGPGARAVGMLGVFVALGSCTEFWAVMISEGLPDVYKHMVLTNMLLALGLPVMLACAVIRVRVRLRTMASPDYDTPAPSESAPATALGSAPPVWR
ncbi:MAG: hypothetical protein M3137_17440 [Actinomycetota bacterium]|nr:hypothetical protein [Actinomycetota bacterium]